MKSPSAFSSDHSVRNQSAGMVATPFTAMGTASAVLALSKAAWKLGSSLSKLEQDTKIVDTAVKNLAGSSSRLAMNVILYMLSWKK